MNMRLFLEWHETILSVPSWNTSKGNEFLQTFYIVVAITALSTTFQWCITLDEWSKSFTISFSFSHSDTSFWLVVSIIIILSSSSILLFLSSLRSDSKEFTTYNFHHCKAEHYLATTKNVLFPSSTPDWPVPFQSECWIMNCNALILLGITLTRYIWLSVRFSGLCSSRAWWPLAGD